MSRAAILFGLLTAALAAVIALQAMPSGDVPDLAAPRRPPLPVQAASGQAAAADPDLVARSLARPLFSPDRRPAPGDAPAGARSGPDEPPRLTGIMITPQGRQAIFAAGERSVAVREGALIGGFMVIGISNEQVTVSGPGGARTLRPSFTAGGPDSASPGSRPVAGTEAAFTANPVPSGLDIIRNAARGAAPPAPGAPAAPVPGLEQTGVAPGGAPPPPPARPGGFPVR